jgi:hypothetical protein
VAARGVRGQSPDADLSAILDTGLDIVLQIDESADPPTLLVTLPFSDATD